MKCTQCQSELFVGSRHCPVCGAPVEIPPAQGASMSKTEFFRLALPQKFQSFLHTGILLCYFSVFVSLISSLWYPASGMLQALLCLAIAIGLQAAKSVAWAYTGTILSAGMLLISILADGNFVCLITLVGCVFASVGAHALTVSYAAYLVSGKTPEIGDEEGRAMVLKFAGRRKFRIIATAAGCLAIGAAAACSVTFYCIGKSADRGYTPGELSEGGRYANEFAGIALDLPEDWTIYSKKALEERNIALAGAGGEDSVIFFALSPDRSETIRLDIIRQSSSIYTEKNVLESYVESGKLLAEADGVDFRAEDFEIRTLGGEEYLCLTTVTADKEQSEVRRTYLCRQIGSYSVLFFLYDKSAAESDILADFQGWFAEN